MALFLILLPKANFSVEKNSDQDLPPAKEEINLEDGYYKVPIKLWHAYEEKESMGNKALIQTAEIEVEGKKAFLYIGSGKMEYMNITASLVSIYFQKEDGKYHAAEAGCFELEVPKEKDKRPEVFRTSLINMDEMTKVYVDPKVEPMGDEPIRARIKLDFKDVEKINESDAVLINKFKNGAPKPKFNKSDSGQVENKNIIVKYEPETFTEEFTFYGNKLSGKKAEEYSKDFNSLDQVNVFEIEFLGPLDQIEDNEKDIQKKRNKIYAEKDFCLDLPLLKFNKDDKLTIYKVKKGEKSKLDFEIKDQHLEIKTKDSGIYLLVKSANGASLKENKDEMPKTDMTKEKRAESFMKTVKKPQARKISQQKAQIKTQVEEKLKAPANQLNASLNSAANEQIKSKLDSESANSKARDVKVQAEIEEKESKALIVCIVLVFIALNAISIFFIRKNLKEIKEMKEEIIFLGGLGKNEKNN